MKLSATLIGLATLLVLAGGLLAQPAPNMERPDRPDRGPGFGTGHEGGMGSQCMKEDSDEEECCGRDELKLTDEQEAKIAKLRLDQRSKMMDLMTDMQSASNKLKKLIIAEKFDAKAVADAAAKLGKLHESKIQIKAEHLRQIRDLLTEDQRLRFDERILNAPLGMDRPGGPRGPKSGACRGGAF